MKCLIKEITNCLKKSGVNEMLNYQNLIAGLTNRDQKSAHKCLLQLEEESARSASVYRYFDLFIEMLDDANSYIRTRGLVLISANARWDTDLKIEDIIKKY